MAEERVWKPTEHQVTNQPPAVSANQHVAPGAGPGDPAGKRAPPPAPSPSLVRWFLGLLLVLAVGWGGIALIGYLAVRWNLGITFQTAGLMASALSFGILYWLEQDLWLSRFMGLRLSPSATPLTETLFLWFFNVAGLLIRSTLSPAEAAQGAEAAGRTVAPDRPRTPTGEADSFREVVETVVFVVMLVLLLKAFLAEAFVIPTGSMATTLLGYHQNEKCPRCGYEFPVNLSKEVDDQDERPQAVLSCICPNCFFHIKYGHKLKGGPRQ